MQQQVVNVVDVACVTPTNRSWQITLACDSAQDALLASGLLLRNRHLDVRTIGVPPTLVSVKMPFEMFDNVVMKVLSYYGKVDPYVLRREYRFADIETRTISQ